MYPDSWPWIALARRIPGGLTEVESNALFQLAWMRMPPIDPVIVELGPARGQASLLLAAGLLGKTQPRLFALSHGASDRAERDDWSSNLRRCGLDEIARESEGHPGCGVDLLFVNVQGSGPLDTELQFWSPLVKTGGLVVLHGASREIFSIDSQYGKVRQVENLVWAVKECSGSADGPSDDGRNAAIEAMLHLNPAPAFAEERTRAAAARLQDYVVRAGREIAEARHAVEALRNSWSWRVTAPLRRTMEAVHTAAGLLAAKPGASDLTQWMRYRKQLRASGLLDERYYRSQNAGSVWAAASPVLHFLVCGAKDGKNPNELFDIEYYVRRYPEVAAAGVNPAVHYLTSGAYAGWDPHPYFDSSFYLEENPDVREAGLNPLAHYLAPGIAEGRDPNPWFDTAEYLEQNPDVATFGLNPLTHQLKQDRGLRKSRECSRW